MREREREREDDEKWVKYYEVGRRDSSTCIDRSNSIIWNARLTLCPCFLSFSQLKKDSFPVKQRKGLTAGKMMHMECWISLFKRKRERTGWNHSNKVSTQKSLDAITKLCLFMGWQRPHPNTPYHMPTQILSCHPNHGNDSNLFAVVWVSCILYFLLLLLLLIMYIHFHVLNSTDKSSSKFRQFNLLFFNFNTNFG